jgi:iron complex outermembrane receptor protein
MRDSIFQLKSVEINGYKPTASEPGVISQKLDTTPITKLFSSSLAEQLGREGNVFIKTNSPGGVATVSIGGSSASQTSLLWNGLLLNNPMLGLYDYSLIPTFLFDQAQVQYGGNGATQGNAAVGGSIQLLSQPKSIDGYATELVAGVGSFHMQQIGVASHYGTEGLQISTRAYFQQAKNDYPFQDLYGQKQTQQNAALNQQGFSQDIFFGEEKNNFSIHTWYLKNEYQIPGSILQNSSAQKQSDEATRTALTWNKKYQKTNLIWNLGYTNDKIRFVDSLIGLDEKSKSYSVQSDLYLAHRISKHWNNSYRLNYYYTEAYTDAYQEKQNIQALNLILKSSFETEKVYAALSNRSSLYIDELNFLLPALDVKVKIYKNFSAIMDASRVYRNPTLNDRFWQPGGNLNIKTERGWNNSAGLEISNKKETWNYKLQAVYFNTSMDNEILWTPSEGGLYFAQNVNQSKSSGVRVFANITRTWKKSAINFWMNASYGNYLVKKNAASLDYKNKIYTPHEIYKWGMTYSYQKLQLNYYGSYAGYTFVTSDNSSWTDAFLLHDISLSYSMEIKNSMLQFYVASKNMLDANYQIVKYRPMPGRSYQVGIHFLMK